MADTLDVLTLAEGRATVGQDRDTADTDLDTELADYITSTSRWIDSVCGPMVVREIVGLATQTSALTLDLVAGATEEDIEDLRVGQYVDVGETGDTKSVAARRRIVAIDRDDLTVTIDGAAIDATSGTHSLWQGRYATTAAVDAVVKIGARMHLRWQWAIERGAGSRDFDDLGAVAGETLAVPHRIIDHLGDFYRPGIG
jgi:hypothetical protein